MLMRNLTRLSHLGLQRNVQRRSLTVASSPLTKFFKVSEEVRAALNACKPGTFTSEKEAKNLDPLTSGLAYSGGT